MRATHQLTLDVHGFLPSTASSKKVPEKAPDIFQFTGQELVMPA
jgi:hypothetical protein